MYWYSSIELQEGVFSHEPKYWTMALPRMAMANTDLKNKKCLDIGTEDGFISTLLMRGGAGRTLAVDVLDFTPQIRAIQELYKVNFEYLPRVGSLKLVDRLMDAHKFGESIGAGLPKDGFDNDFGFDVVVCSGVMYHVYSPLHLLGGLRTLVRPGGLVILETAMILDDVGYAMFNRIPEGYVYGTTDTWFYSIPLLDYFLRMFSLKPIDIFYRNQPEKSLGQGHVLGRGAIVCRAMEAPIPLKGDDLMVSSNGNYEFDELYKKELESLKKPTRVKYNRSEKEEVCDILAKAKTQAKMPIPFDLAQLRLKDTK